MGLMDAVPRGIRAAQRGADGRVSVAPREAWPVLGIAAEHALAQAVLGKHQRHPPRQRQAHTAGAAGRTRSAHLLARGRWPVARRHPAGPRAHGHARAPRASWWLPSSCAPCRPACTWARRCPLSPVKAPCLPARASAPVHNAAHRPRPALRHASARRITRLANTQAPSAFSHDPHPSAS